MTITHRRVALALAATLALSATACSGSDEESTTVPSEADGTTEAPTGGSDTTAAPDGDGPNATVSPSLPEEFLKAAGPLEVIGDPLPKLEDPANDPAVGLPAPVLVGVGYDGVTRRIDGTEHEALLVVFLAHWCGFCNEEVPIIKEWVASDSFPEGLDIMTVSTGFAPDRPNYPPDEWLEDREWPLPVIADGVNWETQEYIGAEAFGLPGWPFLVLIDSDGNVVARKSGAQGIDALNDMVFGRG